MDKPNWKETIGEISAAGVTYRAISEHLGCGLGTIGDLARGKTVDPSYSLGVALLEMHKVEMRKAKRRKAN